jgi:hypothetical protein
MWVLVVLVLSQVEPMYKGGAAPHALKDVGPVDESTGTSPCTVETLRQRVGCTFDGKPGPAKDSEQQSRDNVRLAGAMGSALCRDRAEAAVDEPKEREARTRACVARIQVALRSCTLDGAESILDATGLFSPRAQSCYVELASATQLASAPDPLRELPALPPPPPVLPKVQRL